MRELSEEERMWHQWIGWSENFHWCELFTTGLGRGR